MNREFRIAPTLAVIAAGWALAACDRIYSPSVEHIAARVNGKEIAAIRVAQPLVAMPGNPPGAVTRAALDELIDQELLAQKAEETRLDRDPAVLMEIEAARQRILAQSYVERNARSLRPSPEEIGNFYREHPALFEQRRVYRFNELVTLVDAGRRPAFRSKAADSSKLDEIAGWLKSGKQPFYVAGSVKFSEQIPASLLPRIAAMKKGQIAIFESPEATSVIQLLQSHEAPLSLEEARPAIEKLLLEQRHQAFARSRAKQLRTQARIEYLGPFAGTPDLATPAVLPAGENADKTEAHVLRGLSGLL